MKKRIFAAALGVMLMLTLLPTAALAANATSVWIADKELTSATPYYHNGASGAAGTATNTAEGYNAYYNTETGVLTLNGLDVAGSTAVKTVTLGTGSIDFAYAVFADGDLSIRLSGANTVSTADDAGWQTAIIALGVKGNLTVTGDGELTATGGNVTGSSNAQSNGIYAVGTLTVSGGTLKGVGGAATADYAESIGITAPELCVTGGTVTGTGGSATGKTEDAGFNAPYTGFSEGVYVDTLRVSNGSLTATGGDTIGNAAESHGVYADTLIISDTATVTAAGGKATGKDIYSYSQGVGAYHAFTVSGGTVNATGGEAAVQVGGEAHVKSYGIYAEVETALFSGGTVQATGGKSAKDSFGISNGDSNGGAITVSRAADVTATGGTASDSFGLWCQSSSGDPALGVFNSAELHATGGTASDDSYGIYAGAGDVELSGDQVTATGGAAADRSYGVYAEGAGAAIRVSGGTFNAKSISATSPGAALNKALTRGPGVTAQGSTSSNGANPVDYVDANNATYLWVNVPNTPALAVEPSSASIYTGGTVTLTATPANITSPAYQWYSNTAGATDGATAIDGATSATYTPPATTAGTMYYYCVSGAVTSNIVSVTVTPPPVYDDTDYYQLTFEPNGGSTIPTIRRAEGSTVDLTSCSATRAGYTFDGWYADEVLTTAVTSVKLTKDMTVYAGWSWCNPFVDVTESDYFYDAVLWAAENSVTAGTTATTFAPNATCTRAQTVTFLWRANGSPKPTSAVNPFADVSPDAYYYEAVLWAVEKGITAGTSATIFAPDATVTRGQTVTFLWRAAGKPTVNYTIPFTDVDETQYYAEAVRWAVSEGITGGTGATTFSPANDCTRAQIVTFLFRYLDK